MAPRQSNEIPLYMQIRARLQQRILGGEWGYGAMLPSEHELCADYGISRGTMRQALAALEKEGLIRRERGRGTFAAYLPRGEMNTGLHGRSISFIVPYVRDSFIPTILLGLESVARASGYVVLFTHVENSPEKQEGALRQALQQEVAGIILYPVNSTDTGPVLCELVQRQVPLVLVDRYLRGLNTDYVTSDNFGGGLRATQHLIRLGHRRIAFLSWVDTAVTMEHRRAGYRQALQEAGIDLDPGLEWEVEGYPDIDINALAAHLTQPQRPTAIFAANDQLALAAQRAARSLKMSIPDDLALVGFDNLEISAQLDVPLTTIVQPAFEMGKTAGEIVISKIKGQSNCVEQRILPTKLVVRQSCGAARNTQPEAEQLFTSNNHSESAPKGGEG
jgi:GntR family transcriptional regulator, arabinose operon transcriptional repressor